MSVVLGDSKFPTFVIKKIQCIGERLTLTDIYIYKSSSCCAAGMDFPNSLSLSLSCYLSLSSIASDRSSSLHAVAVQSCYR